MAWLQRNAETGQPNLLAVVLLVFFSLNLLLGTFNLLPVPPLDGSAGIMLFMSESQAQVIWTGCAATALPWWAYWSAY
jgi:Zn-dependent protease